MLYWLTSTHKDYEDIELDVYLTLDDALEVYTETIKEMMQVLPKNEWFNLRVMREPEPTDFMPNRNQVVRAWVY